MTEMLKGELQVVPVPKVVFGPGCLSQALASEVTALPAKRVMVVTGKTLANSSLIGQVKAALGGACAAVFDRTRQHVPRDSVLAGAELATTVGADALVVFGGGSPVDTARGIAVVLAEGPNLDDHVTKAAPGGGWITPKLLKPKLPIIAIPTTLSGGEYTFAAGITNPAALRKEYLRDPQLKPRTVIIDPEMTVATGQDLWAATALKALCDCIEFTCCAGHQPYTDAISLKAAELIFRHLPRSVGETIDLAARGQLQYAAMMSSSLILVSSLGLAGAFRHQIGPLWGVPHGLASSIVIPHVMEFNRPYVADRLPLIAQAAGRRTEGLCAEDAAGVAIDAVRDLVKQMGLPTRLRDVGGVRSDLDHVAEYVADDLSAQGNPRPLTKQAVRDVLERAF